MQSTLRAIQAHRALHLDIIATGIHLLPEFGSTARLIRADGWRIAARVRMQRGDGSPLDQANGLGRGVSGIARTLNTLHSDIVLVVGDRIEALAGALAGVTTGRIVAHVHGGDVAAGDFDDAIRHAITKLSHVHLAATRASAARMIRMGEERRRVHVVGAPAMDELLALTREADARSAGLREFAPDLGANPFALVLHHATGRADDIERRVMGGILQTVARSGLFPWILYPNTDRGHRGVMAAIEEFRRSAPRLREAAGRAGADLHGSRSVGRISRSLPRGEFLRALRDCAVLIGNSSAGMIEAPMMGTPTVNVGDRQRGRQRGGPCVIDCGESPAQVRAAISKAMRMRRRPGRVYGDGHTGPRIAAVLAGLRQDREFCRKLITY
ncbi:MAG: UDP-N-acetylglucosamine 2-epimerase [Phycisphaerales bacterium]|nr:UDP-N-acetylglucosamine 2-epimerase [Phycisphaerales bacterium]